MRGGEILPESPRWADDQIPSGHAAGQVAAILDDAVIVDFGAGFAWFRAEQFPAVVVGDFLTVGPGVSRWRVTPKISHPSGHADV